MPVLAFFLFKSGVPWGVFFHLQDETYLSWVAEVWNCKETYLAYEWLTGKLKFILSLFKHVFQMEGL